MREKYATVETSSYTGRTSIPDLPEGTAFLVVLYGPDMGRRIQLGADPFIIGRVEPVDLLLPEDSVSRKHARLFLRGGRRYAEDLGSTNSTFVNDAPIREVELTNGAQIKVGRTILKYMTGDDVEARYHEEIYLLMMSDALTQARNKRAFDEALPREISRAERYRRELSLVVFDIDHFKRINDTHGHVAGDSVLQQLGGLVRARVREHDTFARVGGEEFALLLPEVDVGGAGVVAEKLRASVASAVFSVRDLEFTITISAGCATWRPGCSAAELYERADKALYAAKQGGRNRVVAAP
ncbi:MAG: GGDEF domain-containing protein [Myxococcales bacterium]|jgi:diguanylate cyclase (GGDEF)-like protein|nr:GGDEF domain-containing protein [Myxococcales bacterium]MBL0196075.1 GGDEF domain-containing protein [Myxococcales bacterium]HQY64174.1 GGDEF domain-containing protein [Polyangiaceae bacterium]